MTQTEVAHVKHDGCRRKEIFISGFTFSRMHKAKAYNEV
jgi:hypothetical protein